jgi:ATP-dependent Clp protease ATP-binding subunit ClpA
MFERFTHSAREAVTGALFQAKELRQSPVGTEHVLLALLADPRSPVTLALSDTEVNEQYVRAEILRRAGAGDATPDTSFLEADAEDTAALKAIGIDLDAVRRAIEENFGPDALRLARNPAPPRAGRFRLFGGGGGHTPFSPRSKKSLELALREAVRLKHNYIAREHLMLGILRDGNGLAARILADAGVDFDRLRTDLTRSLQDKAA